MLSALIQSRLRYPAMHLAAQLVNQRSVQHGPLVLVSEPRKFHTPTIDRDRTVSRRSEPSSRATLMGEQPNPWDLLQPQDVTSRHRGAKPPPSIWALGRDQPVIPGVPFILWAMSLPYGNTGSLCSSFLPDRLVCLPVKRPYAITLYGRLPIVLRAPFRSLRYTFGGDHPPVKLPTKQCPRIYELELK